MSESNGKGLALSRRGFVMALGVVPLAGMIDPLLAMEGSGCAELESLAGRWRVALDPDDDGLARGWFGKPLADTLSLPGNIEQARLGNAVSVATKWTGDIPDRSFYNADDYAPYRVDGQVKVPFCLQPESWYRGSAWFQREVVIDDSWAGKRVELFLERAHWLTQLWIDGREIGSCNALHVPHRYDLGMLEPGRHLLTIRVDNRMIVEIGVNSHGVTDHTQGNWNGLAGAIELRATAPVWIEGVALYPDLATRTLRLVGSIGNASGRAGKGYADIAAAGVKRRIPVRWGKNGGGFDTTVTFEAANSDALATWDEFAPNLHRATVRLDNGEEWSDRFGWRELRTGVNGFILNGRPTMFRGALDCAIFPQTGHPPTDLDSWRKIMRQVQAYGLNHIRFHSYCPPKAAFIAADEAGVYVQVETVWANQSSYVGGGLPVDQWIYEETNRILAAHGNHPSFMLATHGNEPGMSKEADGLAKRDGFLAKYALHFAAKDKRRLWTAGSGWPEIVENQFHVSPTPRVQMWGEGLKSRINAKAPETVTDYAAIIGKHTAPVISHEIGQWCVYPNLKETAKYTGYLKAQNFEIFEDRLQASGLLDLARDFHMASGKLQALCYKEDIESALRTPGMGGFQLLGLQDFSGQGTALVGVVDPFWDAKDYISSAEYRRFCNRTVPLARLERRVFRSGEDLRFTVDIAHFAAAPLSAAQIGWSIVDEGGTRIASGSFDPRDIPIGNQRLDLSVSTALNVTRATAARLIVTVEVQGQAVAENDWDIWVYPKLDAPSTREIREASQLGEAELAYLAKGGTLLLGLPRAEVVNFSERPVELGFSSIFWNTLWTERQAPTTLGVLCDPAHPALAGFPTQEHSNWHWWYLVHRAGALRLDLLPRDVKPIVRIIDDWFTARPLGLVVELAVGKGRIVVCGFELSGEAAADPVSQQMRASLLAYMAGPDFNPVVKASTAQLRALARSRA